MSEEEVLKVIDNVANRLASRFKFGFHTIEDMKQQARLFCIKAMPKYDRKRPLENFLWTHARNRLFNYKRDNFYRPDKPCLNCPLKAYDPHCQYSASQCTEFDDKEDCELYASWNKRTQAKKNVMNPVEMSGIDDTQEKNMKIGGRPMEEILDDAELFRIIDINLPMEFRANYIKMRGGGKVQKVIRDKINAIILEILNKEGIYK